MRFSLLHGFYALAYVALGGCHSVTPEVYWENVLPNTPMPKAIKESLTEWNKGEGASKYELKDDIFQWFRMFTASKDQLKHESYQLFYTYGASNVRVHPRNSPFNYLYGSSKDELKHNPNVALFFLENDLHQGIKMNLHFMRNDQKSMFLPRKNVDSIPFSSNKLPQIYNHFSIKPNSIQAEDMKQTLKECESKGNEGEEKHCATSLESMIDFTTINLGQKVKAISTEVINGEKGTSLQKYKIEMVKKLRGNDVVVCHKQKYPYAVFYCHKTVGTRVYAVSMMGEDDVKVDAVVVCHIDTTKWNPKHLAFQVLKVKPGSVPVCHFLPEDHLVWIPY